MENKKCHLLKIMPMFYEAVKSGEKTFEVRYNDRDYKKGDELCLMEWADGRYTGRGLVVEVSYILDDERYCKEGYVVMGIRLV